MLPTDWVQDACRSGRSHDNSTAYLIMKGDYDGSFTSAILNRQRTVKKWRTLAPEGGELNEGDNEIAAK